MKPSWYIFSQKCTMFLRRTYRVSYWMSMIRLKNLRWTFCKNIILLPLVAWQTPKSFLLGLCPGTLLGSLQCSSPPVGGGDTFPTHGD